jgi:acetyltransferase
MLTSDYRIAHERLPQICFNDYDREIAMVGIRRSSEMNEEEIIGVGRLIRSNKVSGD